MMRATVSKENQTITVYWRQLSWQIRCAIDTNDIMNDLRDSPGSIVRGRQSMALRGALALLGVKSGILCR